MGLEPNKGGPAFSDYRPRFTEGPVPQRVSKYRFLPIWLPSKPDYAKDPQVVQLGKDLLKRIVEEAKLERLPDPWARRFVWRKHPYFSGWHMVRLAFSGFGLATVAFIGYLGMEYFGLIPSNNSTHHHHDAHHA